MNGICLRQRNASKKSLEIDAKDPETNRLTIQGSLPWTLTGMNKEKAG